MPYLEEFRTRIQSEDYPRFLQLWEEYAKGDTIRVDELERILEMVKDSQFAPRFGARIESALDLWSQIEDADDSYRILRWLMDLQTTQSPELQELAIKAVQQRYPDDSQFELKTRLVGLRGVGNFQGALSNYDLLSHMEKGAFVFHTGGWGVGEIMDLSLIREQLVIEFEMVLGKRDFSFQNAFKMLKPLASKHFLARRFGNPDKLEEEARRDPTSIVRMLLSDLGPKSAPEIKDELCEWVIPEEDWTKWWQNARAKLKKDTFVEMPSNIKDPFVLRETEVTHEDRLMTMMSRASGLDETILATYNFVRDFPNMVKKEEVKQSIIDKLRELLKRDHLPIAKKIEILIFIEHFLESEVDGVSLKIEVQSLENVERVLNEMPILAFKKRFLAVARESRDDWVDLFLEFLLTTEQNPLRDYLLKELNQPETLTKLEHQLEKLLHHPESYPETFVWYFQKVTTDSSALFSDKDGQCEFLESFLILINKIEIDPQHRDLVKKMVQLLTKKRYQIIRDILEGSDLAFAREFLLLVTKCQSFSNHDLKIMRSLAEVVHPSLGDGRESSRDDEMDVIWTTHEGYVKTQKRIEHLGTVEIVKNAKEIEAARELGDLKENSEYKYALEKRSRLQSELKLLSDQLAKARIMTKHDINVNEVGIGTVVDLINSQGDTVTYTILGPWDADPDSHLLSFQSKLAAAMLGKKEGESFTFRHESYKVANIRSFLQ